VNLLKNELEEIDNQMLLEEINIKEPPRRGSSMYRIQKQNKNPSLMMSKLNVNLGYF
jgi:hypothetical protein